MSSSRFKDFISNLLSNYCKLEKDVVNLLTNDQNLSEYTNAFTTKYTDPDNNYEFYEFIGDKLVNYIISDYIIKRFPMFENPRLVRFLHLANLNSVNKTNFSRIANNLGFRPFIRISNHEEEEDEKSQLENTFESFCGCTSTLLDKYYPKIGAGSLAIYQFIKANFDADKEMFKSFKYLDIFDPITILKENIMDRGRGKVFYDCKGKKRDWTCTATLELSGYDNMKFGPIHSDDKNNADAKKKVAKLIIDFMKKNNLIIKTYKEIEDIIGDTDLEKKVSNILLRLDNYYMNCYNKVKDSDNKELNKIINVILLSKENIVKNYDKFIEITNKIMNDFSCNNEVKSYSYFARDAYTYYSYYLDIKDMEKNAKEKLTDECFKHYKEIINAFNPIVFRPVKGGNYKTFVDKIKYFVEQEKQVVCQYKHVRSQLIGLKK